MLTYSILHNPGHNRVYFNAARTLALCELQLASRRFSTPVLNVREEVLGRVPYVLFDTETTLRLEDLTLLSRLSFVYALYLAETRENETILYPLPKDESYYFNDDLSAILKYSGKTNELFTRMMLNIAVCCGAFGYNDDLCVLDPLCGKGTTLFEVLLAGGNAYGVELDGKLAHEAYVFFKKYLETGRYKHNSHTEKISGTDKNQKKYTSERYKVELAKTKADQQADKTLQAEFISGDTRYINAYYKKSFFHAIVGDLPYGVQHGSDKGAQSRSRSGKNAAVQGRSITRNALGMLTEALPEWLKVLKPGGCVVLAWNLFLISRQEMEQLFNENGLTLPEGSLFNQFKHRVDQAIERDVIVGVKK